MEYQNGYSLAIGGGKYTPGIIGEVTLNFESLNKSISYATEGRLGISNNLFGAFGLIGFKSSHEDSVFSYGVGYGGGVLIHLNRYIDMSLYAKKYNMKNEYDINYSQRFTGIDFSFHF